jgi:hypothetical protein
MTTGKINLPLLFNVKLYCFRITQKVYDTVLLNNTVSWFVKINCLDTHCIEQKRVLNRVRTCQ